MNHSVLIKISWIFLLSALLLAPLSVEGKTVKSKDGVPIVYDVQGKGDIALVFVHCWCCDRGFWDAQIPHFAKQYKVVSLDLAGHGDSGLKRDKWSMESYAADVMTVIKELKLKKMILIGHSMGGPVIAQTAAFMPGKVLGLIAVDTFHNIEHKFSEEQRNQFIGSFKKDFAGTVNGFVGTMFTPKSDPVLKKKVIDSMAVGPVEVGVGSMEAMFAMDLAQVIKSANLDIRCINATAMPTNVEVGKKYARSFKVKYMEEVGHFLHMEKPELFNKLLAEWIDDLVKK
jgi:pimeloyl-ACP methyl ester carboxylesterase